LGVGTRRCGKKTVTATCQCRKKSSLYRQILSLNFNFQSEFGGLNCWYHWAAKNKRALKWAFVFPSFVELETTFSAGRS